MKLSRELILILAFYVSQRFYSPMMNRFLILFIKREGNGLLSQAVFMLAFMLTLMFLMDEIIYKETLQNFAEIKVYLSNQRKKSPILAIL
jgi:hypothetical protein